jgi:hypothetical protein
VKTTGLTYLEAVNVFLVMGGKSLRFGGHAYKYILSNGKFCDLTRYGDVGYTHGNTLDVIENNRGCMNDTYREWEVEL